MAGLREMNENEERSFGDLETTRDGGGEVVSEGARGFGDRETLRDGWGILEEWGGKRWTAGEEILGRYVVERELGQGGMGVVYGCFDKVGGVRVAVKALPPELSHNSVEMEEVRENFELVYKLSHPNIASVKTLERDGKGECFLVMEVAEGESLRRWMRRKGRCDESGGRSEEGGTRIPPAEAIPILRQVAAALDYAHSKKVVHRDVKPGNVVIDASGDVKVLDFGLAAQIRTSLSRASRAYRGTSGTGPYMAPEQWLGKPQDGKADQYALAVMAYEMLAGRLPFENSELAVLKDAVLHGDADAVPGLPRGAMGALRRAMAKRKEERFGSCGEFVAALAGESGRGSARGKTLMGWVAVLALLAGAVAWWWGERTVRPEGSPHQETVGTETAGEPPAPPEETRLEATSPEEVEEAAAKEEARLAAEKAAEEEARRLEEERVRVEREEQIRQESEELEETVYRLAPLARTKAENAEGMGYDRGQRFGEKLDKMKEKLAQGEAAMGGRNFGKAKTWLEEAMALAGWCEENAPLREAAGRAKGAAEEAKKKAEAMDGAHLGLTAWRKGEKAWERAETAWGKAEFRAATAGWNEAGAAYAESEKAARAEKVKQGLEAARGAKGRGAWEEVIAAADGVLALDGGNAEAKALKAEAAEKPEEKSGDRVFLPMIPNQMQVYLFGEVPNPGAVAITSGPEATVTQVILAQGGATEYEYPKKVKVYSNGKMLEVNVEQILARGTFEDDVPLRDGYVIVVPEKTLWKTMPSNETAAESMTETSTMVGLRQQYRDSKLKLEMMKNSGIYGQKHPDILRLQSVIDELEQQLEGAAEEGKAGLRSDDNVAKGKWEVLKEDGQMQPKGGTEAQDGEMGRAMINVSNAKDVQMLDGNIGYVRLKQFGEDTVEDLQESLQRLKEQGVEALVLDLRGNPGGLLSAAVEVAQYFLNRGDLIVFTRGRGGGIMQSFRARPTWKFPKVPMAVLINGASASASEIVAGALQDNKRAVLVGEKSAGDGEARSAFRQEDGTLVWKTAGYYYRPNEQMIHGQGIEPDVVVSVSSETWLKLMLAKGCGAESTGEEISEDEVVSDAQLERACVILKDMMRGG